MQVLVAFVIVVCLFSTFHPIQSNPKGQFDLNVGTTNPVTIQLNVKPLYNLQFKNVVRQSFDYSCGSAALATLLDYYLGENLTEQQVIKGLMEYGDKQKIEQRRAFSLLDMKQFITKLGYKGAGYKANLEDLKELKQPCILPIEFLGYRHFTVFRGIHDGHIFLADPFRGNTSYPLKTFDEMWYDKIVFIVNPNAGEHRLLELTNDDLRYISEDKINDIITIFGPVIPYPEQYRRDFFFTLPDKYQKYRH